MKKRLLKVEDRFCEECALALRRFIGGMDGVESVDVEGRAIAVRFDETKISDEAITGLAADSLEKLGHKLME
jgi:copper chaperone CopZ